MGKLTRSAGRVLGAGVLVLAGTGSLVLAGGGIATAQPSSTSANACDNVFAVIDSFNTAFTKHPGQWALVTAAATQLTQAASTGSPTVQRTVSIFVVDLRADAAARRVISRPKLVADGDAIVAACSAQPSGAPATGGGSTASVQDPALFGVGGAAVLAGVGVLGLAWRNRPRTGAGHG
jgi:hypothetical protein